MIPWLQRIRGKEEATIKVVLAKDEVKNVIDDFETNSIHKAEGVILIWATHGEVFLDTGGLSEAEVIGLMGIMSHRIQHEGVPKK